MFKHPKYYKELRKRNKAARIPPTSSGQAASDQAISDEASTEATSVRPGPGLKQQAIDETVPHCDIEEASSLKPKRQANEELEGLKRYVKNTKSPI